MSLIIPKETLASGMVKRYETKIDFNDINWGREKYLVEKIGATKLNLVGKYTAYIRMKSVD